jgi:integrase
MASIEKRIRNGQVSYSVRYRDPAGHSRRKVFARKVDAVRWLAENEAARNRGAWVDPAAGRDRLGEWAERWFSSTVALRPGPAGPTGCCSTTRSSPTSAGRPWRRSTRWRSMNGRPGWWPPASARAASATPPRCSARSSTPRWRVAGYTATRPRASAGPASSKREMTFLTAAELERLASQIEDPYRVLVRFLGWTGLRIGEAAALRVGRLDLLARRVEVAEAATEVNGRLAWGPTKTGERRTVPFPHFLADQLGTYLADRPHAPDDLVFTMPAGGPLRASKWGERYFRPAVAAAGLPQGLRVHDLRHTAASLAIRENASVKIVQAMLGHRSATQTLDRYGHLYPSDLDALADRLDRAHAAATTGEVWPQGGPAVVQIRKGAGQ